MIVGVLAFQGDFSEHIAVLHSMHVPAIEVRSISDLSKVGALIIPGGESTVIAKFLEETGVGKEIRHRALAPCPLSPTPFPRDRWKGALSLEEGSVPLHPEGGGARGGGTGNALRPLFVYGTCAGAIVLSKKVTGKNACRSLGLIDVTIDRNAYGTQLDSFEAEIRVKGIRGGIPVSFIRAPKVTRVGNGVEVLAEHDGVPVLVRQGRVLAGTFHPEVRADAGLHQLFLKGMMNS